MSSEQAWRWIESHVCHLTTDSGAFVLTVGGREYRTTHSDFGMRVIVLVTRAIEYMKEDMNVA